MRSNAAEIRDDLPQVPEASEFPNALAAIERTEQLLQETESQAQWDVGDAILQDIPIQPRGVKDGSLERFERLAVIAEANGYPRYSVNYLRRLRSVSWKFPPDVRRRTSYSWTIHDEAGTPEILDKIIRMAQAEGVPVSSRYVRTKRHQIEEGRTRTTITSDLGSTAEAEQKVIPMPSPRVKKPRLQVADLVEELQEKEAEIQQKDKQIAAIYQLAEDVAEFEAAQEREREHPSPVRAMAKAVAEESGNIVQAEIVDPG